MARDARQGGSDAIVSLPRRDANKAAKLARIVEAARAEFQAKGFYEAKLSDVAHAARVAKGTLFLYAESKEALLWLVFSADMRPVLLGSLDPGSTRPLRAQLLEHFEVASALQRAYPELARVAAKELTWANPPSQTTLAFISEWSALLARVIEAAGRRGEVDPSHPPELLSRLLIDLYFGAAQAWLTGRSTFVAAEEQLIASMDLLLTGAAVGRERAEPSRRARG